MAELRNHIILCGLGHIGSRILEVLAGQSVAVITLACDDKARQLADSICAVVIEADARDRRILEDAGVRNAVALIAVTDSDQANLEIALDALELNPNLRVVIRTFDQSFARKIEQAFGVRQAISTSAIAAQRFTAAAAGERVVGIIDVEGRPLKFCRDCPDTTQEREGRAFLSLAGKILTVSRTSQGPGLVIAFGPDCRRHCEEAAARALKPGAGHPAAQQIRFPFRYYWRRVSGVSRWLMLGFLCVFGASVCVFHKWFDLSLADAVYFTVTVMTTTGFGDISLLGAPAPLKIYGAFVMLAGAAILATLYAVIADLVLSSRLEQMLGRRPHRMRNHVIVVGLGNVGYRVVEALARMDERVIAIELCPEGRFVEDVRRDASVVIGDARRERSLLAANVSRAKCIAVLTDEDLLNLEIGLLAREMNPDIRVVLRTYDRDLAAKFRNALQIDCVLSTSELAAPAFADAILDTEVIGSFEWQGERFIFSRRGAALMPEDETPVLHKPPGTRDFELVKQGAVPDDGEVVTVKLAPGR